MPLQYLFIDFNAFFASVEQQENPKLRGKPVAVVPVMAENTACIAASYEAKKFGIKTGTSAKDARKLSPEITILEARPTLYVKYHHQLVDAVESCIPVYAVKSIDEMACELSGSQKKKENAIELAIKIKLTIVKKVGENIRASIGIAPNIFLAKTASDMQKPNGLVVIEEKDLPDILLPLQLEDLSGIGRNMHKRLNRNGIYSVADLWNSDKEKLRKVWGRIEGERFYERLRGIEPPLPLTHHTTVGHSHVLPPEQRTNEGAKAVLHRILQKAAMRLRKMGYRASALHVSIRYYDKVKWGDEIRFSDTDNTMQLTAALRTVLDRKLTIRKTPLKVSVVLFHLNENATHTLSLFDNEEKTSAFNKAVDEINLKYGKSALYFADAHRALESSPARIAFTHIPDLEVEEGIGNPKRKIEKKLDFKKNHYCPK